MLKVYLAGPISGLTFEKCTDWRELAAERLAPEIAAYSPLRANEFLRGKGRIKANGSYAEHCFARPKGIASRDRWDVQTCDVVLMNLLGTTRVSVGTMIEVGMAEAWRKPIVLAIEDDGNLHEHPMLAEYAAFRASTLDDAIDITRAILLPKGG